MNTKSRKVMLSAVQPTNRLTLGNYIGAIRNWVLHQKDYDCLFFAVDLHTLTVRQDPTVLRDQTYRTIATYIAAGVDPDACTLYVQSHVPEHAELGWILGCHTYMGELDRMTQYKDKISKKGQSISAGFHSYPVLMAADILLFHTNLVPVGEDQKQHVELARDLAVRLNQLYGNDLFTVPEPFIPKVGARIMSLQDPGSKMSKSDPDPNSAIYLSDSNDEILKKFKKAVTDSGKEITGDDKKPGVRNLLTIQSALTGQSIEEVVSHYAGKQYSHLKIEVAEQVTQTIQPLREKISRLMEDTGYLDQILRSGAEKASQRAWKTLKMVHDRIGFISGRYSTDVGRRSN